MNKFQLIPFLGLLFLPLIFQGKSIIKVNFPGAHSHQAVVWTYEDLISYREKIVATGKVDLKNNFSFTLTNTEVIPIRIQIEFFKIDLFIEPNRNYEIEIDSADFTNRDFYPKNIIGYLKPFFKIVTPNQKELNSELVLVNNKFAEFYDTNYIYLYQTRLPESVLKKFIHQMDSMGNTLTSTLVKRHIEIQLTQLRLLTRQVNARWVVDHFFIPEKVQYHNKIYMDFFNSYWSKYLLVSMPGMRFGELDSVVNSGSYNALSRLTERDPLLKNTQIREMVILKNIIKMYSDYRFNKKALNDILSDIANKGVTAENRKIAVNIRKQMMNFVDQKAPDFTLPDFNNKTHQLKDFEGKYVYINFWNEQCPKCIAEMDLTKELFLDYDDIIQFVSIYVGPNINEAESMVKNRDYKWLQLNFNRDFEIIQNYKVELFPYYILIDKTGAIEWYPAPLPSESFSALFIKMLNDKKGNLK